MRRYTEIYIRKKRGCCGGYLRGVEGSQTPPDNGPETPQNYKLLIYTMSLIDSTRPLYALTEGEFFQNLEEHIKECLAKYGPKIPEPQAEPAQASGKRYVYGIIGIERAFGVSHKTAQKLKDGILKPAVKQRGRKIVTDLDMAMELFDENKGRK